MDFPLISFKLRNRSISEKDFKVGIKCFYLDQIFKPGIEFKRSDSFKRNQMKKFK
jgi:hypothetical protein